MDIADAIFSSANGLRRGSRALRPRPGGSSFQTRPTEGLHGGTGIWGRTGHCFMALIFRRETYPLRDKFGHFVPPDVIDLYVVEGIIIYRNVE
jgi:hypothetical protein